MTSPSFDIPLVFLPSVHSTSSIKTVYIDDITIRLLEVAEVPSMSQVQSLLDHTLSTATDLTSHLYCIHEL